MTMTLNGACPLFALDAVGFDLETTGLHVHEDRIVQIGAVHVGRSGVLSKHILNQIIDPHIPIPPQTTAIHGITDAMARQAPDLVKVWPDLQAFLRKKTILGHTIAFDLTILEHEAARYKLHYQKPRSLDIQLLASLILPELFGHSLEKLAAWFGVEIHKRHDALSDAQTAAEIFVKMLPLLADQGIRTLAEAERASLTHTHFIENGRKAGWVSPVSDPAEMALTGGVINFDTYAYRHTVGAVMKQPLKIVSSTANLKQALSVMTKNRISSVLVAASTRSGQKTQKYAILTERDVMRAIVKHGQKALLIKVSSIATSPVRTIRENAYLYRAIARMQHFNIRHLLAVDDVDRATGMISVRDVLHLRSEPAIILSDAINNADSIADLAVAWATLPNMVGSLISEGLDAHIVTGIVSDEMRAMTERAAHLAERSMTADGMGTPPCPYSVMVLGSGGRGESLLRPDQDNAIIFKKGDPGGKEDKWFAELGNRFAAILNEAGIPFCDGGIMAMNDEWRGSVTTWQSRLAYWINHSTPQSLLNVDIFFDQVPVYGDHQLAIELFKTSYEIASQNPAFSKVLAAKLDFIENPIGLFGKVKATNNALDLKLHALFPLVASARSLAIRHDIAVHSTRERLERLVALDHGDVHLLQNLISDHRFCLGLMLKTQQYQIASGQKPTNFIDLGKLDKDEMTDLKKALHHIQLIPELVKDLMF